MRAAMLVAAGFRVFSVFRGNSPLGCYGCLEGEAMERSGWGTQSLKNGVNWPKFSNVLPWVS
ncbi:hypothetical protein Q31a_52360 [Aureliella helgolandensis]|uniref:Uncharacterized protein n=1 Tax=Aureliella helgolandensis TaxID=2527968 RepID=A0A518GE78_9BACT|nr:hypothetical protein Q31a_52360 [Aureliella helgolandensis]